MQMAIYCIFVGVDNEKGQSPFVFSPDVTGFMNVCDELMLWIRSTHVLCIYMCKYNIHAHLSLYKKLCVCVHSCTLLHVYSTKLYLLPRY